METRLDISFSIRRSKGAEVLMHILILLQKEGCKSGVAALCVRQRCALVSLTSHAVHSAAAETKRCRAEGEKGGFVLCRFGFLQPRCTKRHKLRSAEPLAPAIRENNQFEPSCDSRQPRAECNSAASQSDRTVSIGGCISILHWIFAHGTIVQHVTWNWDVCTMCTPNVIQSRTNEIIIITGQILFMFAFSLFSSFSFNFSLIFIFFFRPGMKRFCAGIFSSFREIISERNWKRLWKTYRKMFTPPGFHDSRSNFSYC